MSSPKEQNTEPLPYASKGDLTSGSIIKHLIRLTLPMTWGIMAVVSVQLVDTYFIGLLGAKQLAAISFTFPVTLSITHLLFGLNIAMSSVVSRLIGGGDQKNAKRIVLHGIILAIMAASTFALICYIFLVPLFQALGAQDEILNMVTEYMPLWLIGSVILAIPMNGNSAIRAGGDALRPAIVMTLSAVTNAVMDPILIFGHFGMPAMGIKGAAIASVIGYSMALLLGMYFLIFNKKMVATDGLYLNQFKDSAKRLSFIAIPAGITNVIMPAIGGFIVAILAKYGDQAVAAYGVSSRIEAFTMLLIIALSSAMAPIIGQNWGAKNYDRARQTIQIAVRFNLIWSLGVALILALFGHTIAAWFTNDPAIVKIITIFFYIVPITYGIGNLVFGWASAFNAIGKPINALIMIVVRSIVFTIPFIWIGEALFSIKGIFYAIAAINLISGLIFHVASSRFINKKCIAHTEPA